MNDIDKSIVKAPAAMIELAITKGADLEKLEKILELQERWESNEAKKAYHVAMAEFKANLPPVLKDKTNKQYSSMYVSESALLNTINPVLSEYDLHASYSFPESQVENTLKVSCVIAHKMGHSESVTLPGPIDTSGSKNPLQQVKSTVTYLRKATFEAITGIATSDPSTDDNGNAAGTAYITEEEVKIIELLAEETNSDVLAWLKIESIDMILAKDFKTVESGLRTKAKKKKPTREPREE